jgi:hypothetical protein
MNYRRNAVVIKLIEVEGSLDINLKGENREEYFRQDFGTV